MTISEILDILRKEPDLYVYGRISGFDSNGKGIGGSIRLSKRAVYDHIKIHPPDSTIVAIYYSGLKELHLF